MKTTDIVGKVYENLERDGKLRRISVTLPYPPSVNTYWRCVNNRLIVSSLGRAYQNTVSDIIHEAGLDAAISHRCKCHIAAYPPDNRRRDLDNILKATFDAVTKSGLWKDDSLVDILSVSRMGVKPPGRIEVYVDTL